MLPLNVRQDGKSSMTGLQSHSPLKCSAFQSNTVRISTCKVCAYPLDQQTDQSHILPEQRDRPHPPSATAPLGCNMPKPTFPTLFPKTPTPTTIDPSNFAHCLGPWNTNNTYAPTNTYFYTCITCYFDLFIIMEPYLKTDDNILNYQVEEALISGYYLYPFKPTLVLHRIA